MSFFVGYLGCATTIINGQLIEPGDGAYTRTPITYPLLNGITSVPTPPLTLLTSRLPPGCPISYLCLYDQPTAGNLYLYWPFYLLSSADQDLVFAAGPSLIFPSSPSTNGITFPPWFQCGSALMPDGQASTLYAGQSINISPTALTLITDSNQQIVTERTTGFVLTTNSTTDWLVIYTPATLPSGTVFLPNPTTNARLLISSNNPITAFTVANQANTFSTQFQLNGSALFQYTLSSNTWARLA